MAEARLRRESNFDTQFEIIQEEITQTFQELFQALEQRKNELLSLLATMKATHDKNIELDVAIKQLKIAKENALNNIKSNLLGEELDSIKHKFEERILVKEEMKVFVNMNLIAFRCLSEQILKAIEETDLVVLTPEYVGRENPIMKKWSKGTGNARFHNPSGITIDKNTNEVYIADKSNHRIQVMSINGEFFRSIKHDKLIAPHGICLSDNEIYVTDKENYLLKFSKSGEFLKQTGSRGTMPGCFFSITGLCYDEGLVCVCDGSIQRIQIFDSNLEFVDYFAYGKIKCPVDITMHANSIYILSQDQNEIYCYYKDCQQRNIIRLTGQKIPMLAAIFFTIDSKGNFLISENSKDEIRIFSPNGVLKHTLGRGHLHNLAGIALDNTGAIVCVNHQHKACFQKY